MPALYRILEVTVYSLLNFLPFLALALYPFRKSFRFPKYKTAFLIVLVSFIQIGLGISIAILGAAAEFLSVISTLIYALFFFVTVKSHVGKTIFSLLMTSNIANFVVIASKCLEGLIFGDIAYESYRITFSLMLMVVECVTLIPLFFYIRETYSTVFEKDSSEKIWRFLWLIPATFYLIWYFHLYGNNESSLDIALQPNKTLLLLFINLGALFIYQMVFYLITVLDANTNLVEQNYQLAMHDLLHENLQDRINEARQAKHDIRHHITIMDDLLKRQEYDQLHTYLDQYKKSIPDDRSIVLCGHYATNTLLLYFAHQARSAGIDFKTSVSLPKELSLPDNVLSVILGNLLENAIEACDEDLRNSKFISVKGKYTKESHSLFFQIENTSLCKSYAREGCS